MTRGAAPWAIIGGAAIGMLLLPAAIRMPPVLLWNATASTPVGLYRLQSAHPLRIGELVAAMPPEPIAAFLARGGFLPRGVPLLKHIAALPGQIICRAGDTITIGGIVMGKAHNLDSRARPLPRWSGCRTLAQGQVFLMNPTVPDSLDGRYFGPIPASSIVEQAIPLWLPHAGDVRAGRASAALSPFLNQKPERNTPWHK